VDKQSKGKRSEEREWAWVGREMGIDGKEGDKNVGKKRGRKGKKKRKKTRGNESRKGRDVERRVSEEKAGGKRYIRKRGPRINQNPALRSKKLLGMP